MLFYKIIYSLSFQGTINSKINGTPKVFTSLLHSILAVANLLAHNNATISVPVRVLVPKSFKTVPTEVNNS